MLSWIFLFCLTITTAHAQYWTVTGNLTYAHTDHTATLLPNGNTLVAGGYFDDNGDTLNSAELYNATTGVWTVTGNLTYAREYYTATLLPNGNVLVAGGTDNGNNVFNSAELYNATTGMWTVTGNLTFARYEHTATLLTNGNVLVAAGFGTGTDPYLNTAEVYNSTTGVWTVTGNLTNTRWSHTATMLLNRNVLVAGGYNSGNTAELYNATTGVWTVTGLLTHYRQLHTATLLPNGNVLVAGGFDGGDYLNSAELYNAATGLWTVTGNLTYAREYHTATQLPNGNVLVAGGYNGGCCTLDSAELYNATTGIWTVTGNLTYAREYHTATQLPNGNVLVAGGYNGINGHLNSAELYNPTNTAVTATPTPTTTPTSTPTPIVTSTPTFTTTQTPTAISTPIPSSTLTPIPTSTPTLMSTSTPTPTPTPTSPTPTSSSTGSINATPTPSEPAVSASSDAGAIAGGIGGGLVGLALLVLLLWLFRSRYWHKKAIKEKENKSLDGSSGFSQPILENSGYSQPRLEMSDMKSERPASYVPVDTRMQSAELMSDRTRSATGSSSILSKSDDILIPFSSLKLGAVLGQGNFGQVFQATYRGGSAAVKKLKGVEKQQIMEEARMMKSVPPHSNVLYYFGVSEHDGEIMMVTELCDKGNLSQFLRNSNNKLNAQQYRQLCCQIASGMWHVSTYGIVHRDLRAENVLLQLRGTEVQAKVADFGLARSLQSRDNTRDSAYYRMTEAKEIPIAWTPPEVLTDQLKYVAASDVWSFGIVMWEIYSGGCKPFDGMSVQLMAASIRDPNRTTSLLARPTDCPNDVFAIMNSCWAFNPQDRPTFEQLYNQLS